MFLFLSLCKTNIILQHIKGVIVKRHREFADGDLADFKYVFETNVDIMDSTEPDVRLRFYVIVLTAIVIQ